MSTGNYRDFIKIRSTLMYKHIHEVIISLAGILNKALKDKLSANSNNKSISKDCNDRNARL